MFDHKHLHPYTLSEILPLITTRILGARERIFSTHFLASRDDFFLPGAYIDALAQSSCTIRRRILFGERGLFEEFELLDRERSLHSGIHHFQNQYTSSSNYQRLLIVDLIVFFNMGDRYFMTEDPEEYQIFLDYFSGLIPSH